VWTTSSLDKIHTPTHVALGNFDGVHRGHRHVIEPILNSTLEHCQPNLKRAVSTVVTFHPHPQEFFTGIRREMLTPLNEKIACLQGMGVEQLILLPFTAELVAMTPEAFVEIILMKHLQAQRISVGQDFCFGQNRSGTSEQLKTIAQPYRIQVETVPLYRVNGERISSSAIRQALRQGDVEGANQLLGRPYTLIGSVITGQQLGRTIGFPTANLQLPPEKFLPKEGVYAVEVQNATLEFDPPSVAGVMNIGNRPTVDGLKQTIEVHLLDWSGNLYGQTLIVSLKKFLRSEQKFTSLDALKAQIQADCDLTRSLQITTFAE